jgi:hypothetical protein
MSNLQRRSGGAPTEADPASVRGRVTAMGQAAPEAVKTPLSKSDPLVPLSVRVPGEVRKRLRMAALEQGRTVQDCLLEALQVWLKAQP